jgi:hypothetical protein
VGGSFAAAGDVLASGIARWDGATWSAFGTGGGLNGPVFAMATDGQGNVVAGGDFTVAGGGPASHIASWNGTSWAPLGPGLNGRVKALVTTADGLVYAGGDFTMSGSASIGRVACWDGTAWATPGDLPYGIVNALTLGKNGEIYAGGSFGNPSYRVIRWDGVAWSRVGSDPWDSPSSLLALAVDAGGNLYAAGRFGGTDAAPAYVVRKWNGTAWTARGSWPDFARSPAPSWWTAPATSTGVIVRDYAMNWSAIYRAGRSELDVTGAVIEPLGTVDAMTTDGEGTRHRRHLCGGRRHPGQSRRAMGWNCLVGVRVGAGRDRARAGRRRSRQPCRRRRLRPRWLMVLGKLRPLVRADDLACGAWGASIAADPAGRSPQSLQSAHDTAFRASRRRVRPAHHP